MTNATGFRFGSFLSLLASLSLTACGAGAGGDTGSAGSSGAGGATGSGGTGVGGTTGAGGTGSPGTGGSSAGTGSPGTGGSSAGTGGGSNPGTAGSGGSAAGTGGSSGGSGGSSGGGRGGGSNPGTAGSSGGRGGSAAGTGGSGGRGGFAGGTGGASAGVSGGGTGGGSAGAGGSGTPSGENTGASCNVTSGALKKNTKLPNPFANHDGSLITTKAQWECRRNEIKKDIEKYEIGPKQEPPTVQATLSGATLSVKVTTSAGTITLTSTTSGTGPCAVIGMNGNSSMVTGCKQIPFSHDQVVKYAQTSSQSQSDPFYKVYPELWGKIGNYSAWSWGISRLIDGIVQLKDQLGVDPTKIAVHGCSYAGKMALFGGAFDERVALTVAQESGGGGVTSWRTSQDFSTRTGTQVEKIDNTNYAWFMMSMKSLDPYSLPHDHHELIAMIAPRAVIALGNPEYEWLGDESGYKSIMAASEVFKALGIADHLGYDFTGNHPHCMAPSTQQTSVTTFVNRYLKGTSTTSNVAIKPVSSKFMLDPAGVIDWTTPTLQ